MITGAHSIIYSKNAEADRTFLRDVVGLTNVDVGGGWLIFGLPPAEVAVHPSDDNDHHEFYLMCDDVAAFVAEMEKRKVVCGAVQDMRWGLLTQVTLPGGGRVGVYQPRHPRPKPMVVKTATAAPKKTAATRVSASVKKSRRVAKKKPAAKRNTRKSVRRAR